MKKFFLIVILLICLNYVFAVVIDEIVAKVGNDIILKSELDDQYNYIASVSNKQMTLTKLNILNSMIEDKLIVQKAKQDNIVIDDYKVNGEIDNYINNIKSQFKSEDQYITYLEENGFTPYEFRKFYKDKKVNQKLKNEIIRSKILNKINITDAELEEYYSLNKDNFPKKTESEKIGIILRKVEVSEETKDNILKEMNKIIDQINEGAKFSDLAKKNSDGPSGKKGGDLGFFSRGMMVKDFENAAFKLQEGEISNIVKTKFGYHLIKMEEKKGDEIRVRHILKEIKPTDLDYKAEKEMMKKIHTKLEEGKDFQKLALKYSEADNVLENNGILGEFTSDTYPAAYSLELDKLNVGDISGIIENDDSYAIVKKMAIIPERAYKFVEIKDKLYNKVKEEKTNEYYTDFVNELKKNHFVKILLEE